MAKKIDPHRVLVKERHIIKYMIVSYFKIICSVHILKLNTFFNKKGKVTLLLKFRQVINSK